MQFDSFYNDRPSACKMKSAYGSVSHSSKDNSNVEEGPITIEDAIEIVGVGRYQIEFFLIIILVLAAESMELMLLSVLSPALACEWGISSLQQAMLTTVVFLGMVCSCSLWGHFTDRFGRKTGLLTAVIFTLIFGLLSSAAPNYGWLIVLRGLAGCGLGSVTLAHAMFCEYLPIKYRAQGLLCLIVFWGVGSVCEVLVGLLVMDSLGWRVFVALSAVPLVLFLILAPPFMDESARYLLVSGQSLKARQVMEKIAHKNGAVLPEGNFVDETCHDRGNIRELFSDEMRKSSIILFILWFLVIFVYYGFVLFGTELYASDDPCKGGLSNNVTVENASCGLTTDDYISLLWSSAAEIPGCAVGIFLVNTIGRKKTISGEIFLTAICIISLLACLGNLPMTVLISFGRGLGFGCFATLVAYTPEVYPTPIRAIGTGTCSGIGRMGAALTPLVAQVAASASLNIPIIVYSTLCFIGAILALCLPIETMGIGIR